MMHGYIVCFRKYLKVANISERGGVEMRAMK